MHPHQSKNLLAGNRPLYQSLPSLGATGIFLALFILTVFHLWLCAYLPPAEDELYYWSWAQNLQPSYWDHPPMTAYMIRASTALFGDSVFSIRLPAVVTGLFVFLSLLALANRGNLVWAFLLCPVALFGSVLMTPDTPLVLFWVLYALWFAWINKALDTWSADPITRVYQSSPISYLQWILGGVVLGFGGLSKYTMVLAVPCGLVVLATRTRFRAWGPGYALHLLVAGVLVFPVFLFNWRLGFVPFSYQWNHSMNSAGFSLSGWFGFVGTQIALIGALPFVMFPWIVLRHRDLCADAKSQVYFCFFVLPFVFFFYKALSHPLEANWAIISYLTFWPVADRLISWSSFRGAVRVVIVLAFAVPWVVSVALLVHLASPLSRIPPRSDRMAILKGQWEAAQAVATEIKARGLSDDALFLANYQWTSYFRFLKTRSEQIVPAGRHSQFTLGLGETCHVFNEPELLYLDMSDVHSPGLLCYPHREVLNSFPILSRGVEVGRVWLSRYRRS